jgi:hypothetical protein
MQRERTRNLQCMMPHACHSDPNSATDGERDAPSDDAAKNGQTDGVADDLRTDKRDRTNGFRCVGLASVVLPDLWHIAVLFGALVVVRSALNLRVNLWDPTDLETAAPWLVGFEFQICPPLSRESVTRSLFPLTVCVEDWPTSRGRSCMRLCEFIYMCCWEAYR